MMRISTVVSRWGSRSRLLHPSAVATWRQPIQPRLLENKVWTASLSSMAHPQKQRGAFSHDNTIEMVPRSLLAKRHQEALKSSFQRFGYQMANVNPIRPDGLLSVRSAVERCIPKSMVTVLDVLTDIRCYQCNDPDFAKALSEHVAIHKDDAACVAELVHSYCGHIGYEFEHCSTEAERAFFVAIIEDPNSALQQFDDAWIFEQLYRAELFEQLLHERYSNARTFGIEGMESAVLAINTLVETFANTAAEERCKVLLGTTHRGRINFLANCLHTNWSTLISEWDPTSGPTYDDICLGSSSSNNGLIELLPIPAHLEAMVPGLQGKARAHAEELARNLDDETKKGAHHTQSPLATHLVLPLSLHGDASFCGEGIIQETLQLSTCKHYECGGTIHMILNNQVGYTTELSETKSERFLHTQSSDVAKSINAPILHVNANRPRAVVRACQIALLYRQTFGADILIDLVGWRKHGHNELDDPTMTNVDLYKTVKKMESVTEKFMDELAHPASLALAKIDGVKEEVDQIYQAAKGIKRQEAGDLPHEQKTGSGGSSAWSNIKARPSDTSLPEAQFKEALAPLTTVPDEFQLHPIVKRVVDARKKILAMPPETRIDWATAELLALSSLATEGVPVRLTGEDTERGTFAQRHAVWHDMAKQGHEHHAVPPLLEIANSPLSELSVVGFEFGWSLCNPNSLCLWEAQFGDFSDEAQVIFDTLISSSASKWNEESNLVLLLPHGYDGMGPDHSSCRPERWLQMFASSWSEADSPPTGDPDPVEAYQACNFIVACPTDSSNYFHLLRRQLVWSFRRPLIVLAPKRALRNPAGASPLSDFLLDESGHAAPKHFVGVLDDPFWKRGNKEAVSSVLLCCGELYYDLAKIREQGKGFADVALIRLEQLAPFPSHQLEGIIQTYPQVQRVAWAQEEPSNDGALTFVREHLLFQKSVPTLVDVPMQWLSRPEAAAPADGHPHKHARSQQQLIDDVLEWNNA